MISFEAGQCFQSSQQPAALMEGPRPGQIQHRYASLSAENSSKTIQHQHGRVHARLLIVISNHDIRSRRL